MIQGKCVRFKWHSGLGFQISGQTMTCISQGSVVTVLG